MDDLIISQPMTFTVDVKTGLVERPQRESLMRGDKYANRIIVELVDGSKPFDITGVTVKGEFCKPPNGDSINLPGEAKDNVAEVQLTDQCYTAGGHYEARVILVLDEVERTVLFISGDVLKSGSGNEAGEEPGGEPGGGSTGSGLPAGGTAGQVLVKVSSAQGDAIWKTLKAEDVGARPDNWTPTAEDVGARPNTWTPTAEETGALKKDGTAADSEKLGGKTWTERLLEIYPEGSIYMSVNETSPAILFGGTWESIYDTYGNRFLLAAGGNYAVKSTGGEEGVTLTHGQLPKASVKAYWKTNSDWGDHNGIPMWSNYFEPNAINQANNEGIANENYAEAHVAWINGSGQAHNNMPPYLAVNVWKRVS